MPEAGRSVGLRPRAVCNKLTQVGNLSTDDSECLTVVPVLDGQTCIDELLMDLGDVLSVNALIQMLPEAGVDGIPGGQLRLF